MSNSDAPVWLVTGTSTGFGRALVDILLEAGERVVATLRTPHVLQDLQKKYDSKQLLVLTLDVTNASQVTNVFETIKKSFGRLDVVVNNAGYTYLAEVEAMSDAAANEQMDVLFWGPVRITKAAVKFFREVNPPGKGGRILQMSSIGGFSGMPLSTFYSAAKFALEGFTEGFSKEMLPAWNIKMTIIEPGGHSTDFLGRSAKVLPPPAEYTDPSAPTAQFREFIKAVDLPGDPIKAAKALLEISKAADPPMRLPLGVDGHQLVEGKCKDMLKELEKWKPLSVSTVRDGASGKTL